MLYVIQPTDDDFRRFDPMESRVGCIIEVFVRTFAHYTPWQKGNRHESMLALGRSARRKGFSKEELEKLTSVMTVKIVGDGYSLQELRKNLSSGYQYVNLSYTPSPEAELLSPLSTVT